MKSPSIDASIVPVIYRVEAISEGVVIGEGTVQCLPSEIASKVADVRTAFEDLGFDVTVSHWAA